MRERQLRHLVTAGTVNAKFSPGGLVDVEYLVQGLQLLYGGQHASLRQTNTAGVIDTLRLEGLLSDDDHRALRDALVFLRRLIDALRMVRGNAKDLTVPPAGSEELAYLARRLHYGEVTALESDLDRYTESVRVLSTKLLKH